MTRAPRHNSTFAHRPAPLTTSECPEWVRDAKTGKLRPCGKPKAKRKNGGRFDGHTVLGCCEYHLKTTTPLGNGWKGV